MRSNLEKGLSQDPCNFDLLYALFSFHMKQNNRAKAAPVISKLKSCYPGERQVQEMYNDFVKQ